MSKAVSLRNWDNSSDRLLWLILQPGIHMRETGRKSILVIRSQCFLLGRHRKSYSSSTSC